VAENIESVVSRVNKGSNHELAPFVHQKPARVMLNLLQKRHNGPLER